MSLLAQIEQDIQGLKVKKEGLCEEVIHFDSEKIFQAIVSLIEVGEGERSHEQEEVKITENETRVLPVNESKCLFQL